MPPKSACLCMHSGGIPPPTSQSQAAPPPLSSDTHDSAFDFLAKVPSPVTLLMSQTAPSGVASPSAPLPHAQTAAPPPSATAGDPFAFMAKVPSPVVLPPSQQGQGSGTATHTVATTLSASPALPPPSQLATLPTHIAAGDSAISFMANVPSQETLQEDIDPVVISDSPPHVGNLLYVHCLTHKLCNDRFLILRIRVTQRVLQGFLRAALPPPVNDEQHR